MLIACGDPLKASRSHISATIAGYQPAPLAQAVSTSIEKCAVTSGDQSLDLDDYWPAVAAFAASRVANFATLTMAR